MRGRIVVIKLFDKAPVIFQRHGAQRYKFEGQYDRLVVVGDRNSHICCVIICKYARESNKLFQDYTLALGSMVDILEPQFLKTSLGQDENNPIITTTKPLRAASIVPFHLPALEVRDDLNTSVMLHFAIKGKSKFRKNIYIMFL